MHIVYIVVLICYYFRVSGISILYDQKTSLTTFLLSGFSISFILFLVEDLPFCKQNTQLHFIKRNLQEASIEVGMTRDFILLLGL